MDYLYESTIIRLAQNLPLAHSLSSITLDICGSLLPGDKGDSHTCRAIANIIPRIPHLWVRMIEICPDIFEFRDVKSQDVKLQTLVIKQHLPICANNWLDGSSACLHSRAAQCGSGMLYEHLARASQSFLAKLTTLRLGNNEKNVRPSDIQLWQEVHTPTNTPCHGLTALRISYPDPEYTHINTLDCLTVRILSPKNPFFKNQDHGTPYWYELTEENGGLVDISDLLSTGPSPIRNCSERQI